VNSIRSEAVASDTNVFVFALRKEAAYPACKTLLFDNRKRHDSRKDAKHAK